MEITLNFLHEFSIFKIYSVYSSTKYGSLSGYLDSSMFLIYRGMFLI